MNRIGAKNQWNHLTSDPPPSGAGRPRSATTDPCHRPHASCPRRKRAPTTTSARPAHHGILAPCPLRRPCCQHVLPRPRRATTCRRCRAAQARPKAHSAAAHPASSIPASARAHPHACWNAAGCAIHAATWTDELCDSKPTLVQSSRADEPIASNRRQRMTSHETALGADQRHRERAVLAINFEGFSELLKRPCPEISIHHIRQISQQTIIVGS